MPYAESEKMIEISDAARAYGVSRSTIDCFVETGYLRIEKEAAGTRFLNRDSLAAVFGAPLHSDQAQSTELKGSESSTLASEIEVESTAITESDALDNSNLDSAEAKLQEAVEESQSHQKISSDLMKFKNIASVQEQILKVREEQIKELKEEREWLRARLERMEQSAQRDQLLLLASNETLRNIVNTKNRSALRVALEWFGFVEPNQAGQPAISLTQSPAQK